MSGFILITAGILVLSHASARQFDIDREVDHQSSNLQTESSTRGLLINTAISQALFAGLLASGIWLAQIPVGVFGITVPTVYTTTIGVSSGIGIMGINRAVSHLLDQPHMAETTAVRRVLTPGSRGGWGLLVCIVLPMIAVFEEAIFRGAMIGAIQQGYDVPIWVLIIVSSTLFGFGHSAQGRVGMVMTAIFGVILGTVFVLTESLTVVIIAHYIVNLSEFVYTS